MCVCVCVCVNMPCCSYISLQADSLGVFMGFTADYTVTPASGSELVFYHTVVPSFTTNYLGFVT